jgi:hypothetical protein
MNDLMLRSMHDDEDGLRFLALSRIPQCTTCPRLAALRSNHQQGCPRPVPDAPRACTYLYCAPLVRRYGKREVEVSSSAASSCLLARTDASQLPLTEA